MLLVVCTWHIQKISGVLTNIYFIWQFSHVHFNKIKNEPIRILKSQVKRESEIILNKLNKKYYNSEFLEFARFKVVYETGLRPPILSHLSFLTWDVTYTAPCCLFWPILLVKQSVVRHNKTSCHHITDGWPNSILILKGK